MKRAIRPSLEKSTRDILLKRKWEKVPMEQSIQRSIDRLVNSTCFECTIIDRVAIKRIDDVFRTRTDAKRTLREITILRQCDHPNICKLRYSIVEDMMNRDVLVPPDEHTFKNLWTIQEYGGWDLSRIVKNAQKIAGWGLKHVKYITYQMLCGLLYMQSGNIVHRDLKPSNILINGKCELKIIDFGLARQMSYQYREVRETKVGICISSITVQSDVARAGLLGESFSGVERQLTQHVVTRWYRAPELILLQQYYNTEIDIWSIGCILVFHSRHYLQYRLNYSKRWSPIVVFSLSSPEVRVFLFLANATRSLRMSDSVRNSEQKHIS